MTSIQKAAEKLVKERKHADLVRIKVGHMLTFNHLVGTDMAERQVARKFLRKSMVRAAGCLALPLTMAYFGFYITSIRLHEDITNVFMLESAIRNRLDDIFVPAHNVEKVWDVLMSPERGKFMDMFFNHYNMYGEIEQRNETEDTWGQWNSILTYSQIQGAIRIEQTRKTTADYGTPYDCRNDSAMICSLCRSNGGFQTLDNTLNRPPLSKACDGMGRRLEADKDSELTPDEEKELGEYLADDDFHPRRLHMGRVELRSSMRKSDPLGANDTFMAWLYPSETQEEAMSRLRYYKDRNWIDEDTVKLEIRMYLMNPELGRNRLEQVTITLHFSEAGSVYYERAVECFFLKFFYGMMSLGADGMFGLILLMTTAYRLYDMWKAFLVSKLFEHMMSMYTIFEWLTILIGWWNLYGFYQMWMVWEPAIVNALKPVHRHGWDIGPSRLNEVQALFTAGDTAIKGLANMRPFFAQYSVVLMFRFFFSFASQARLAIVLTTMQNVLMDLLHFLIVFLPTAFAYVISGSLIFGRRIEGFATILGSLGTCFRIAIESEYDWEDMSAEFYTAAAMWAWSFLLLVVLLFLNMVLAIILDIYNQTREKSFPGEAIWETLGHLAQKSMLCRTWVPDKTFEKKLTEESDGSMVDPAALEDMFPDMPARQKKLFFQGCRAEMQWESKHSVTKNNLFKMAGSVMDAVEHAKTVTSKMATEDSVKPWITTADKGTDRGKYGNHDSFKGLDNHTASSFLTKTIGTKGARNPTFDKTGVPSGGTYGDSGPEWLQEVWQLLHEQRKFIELANQRSLQLQCEIQRSIETRPLTYWNQKMPEMGGMVL